MVRNKKWKDRDLLIYRYCLRSAERNKRFLSNHDKAHSLWSSSLVSISYKQFYNRQWIIIVTMTILKN